MINVLQVSIVIRQNYFAVCTPNLCSKTWRVWWHLHIIHI